MAVPRLVNLWEFFLQECQKRLHLLDRDGNGRNGQKFVPGPGEILIPLMKPLRYQGVGEKYHNLIVRGKIEMAIEAFRNKKILSALFYEVEIDKTTYLVVDQIGEVGKTNVLAPFGAIDIWPSRDVPKEDKSQRPALIPVFGAIEDDQSDDGDIDRLFFNLPEDLARRFLDYEGEDARSWWDGSFWGE